LYGAGAAAFGEGADDEDVADRVKAAERSIRVQTNRILEEPKAYVGVTAVVEAVGKKGQYVMTGCGIVIPGGATLGNLIFVRYGARSVTPIADIVKVFGAALCKDLVGPTLVVDEGAYQGCAACGGRTSDYALWRHCVGFSCSIDIIPILRQPRKTRIIDGITLDLKSVAERWRDRGSARGLKRTGCY
jgi:hypothetical protein